MEVSDVPVHGADPALPVSVGVLVHAGGDQGGVGLHTRTVVIGQVPLGAAEVEARLGAADVGEGGLAVRDGGANAVLQKVSYVVVNEPYFHLSRMKITNFKSL